MYFKKFMVDQKKKAGCLHRGAKRTFSHAIVNKTRLSLASLLLFLDAKIIIVDN